MTPPEAPETGTTSAVSLRLQVLKKRADFLAAARAARVATPGLVLQARARSPHEDASGIRVGFTCTKKVGNAVARNRAKRRLREIARLSLLPNARAGWDYVLIGRAQTTASLPFARLQADLESALKRIHSKT